MSPWQGAYRNVVRHDSPISFTRRRSSHMLHVARAKSISGFVDKLTNVKWV